MRRRRLAAAASVAAVLCAGCVIDEPAIERTDGANSTIAVPTVTLPTAPAVATGTPATGPTPSPTPEPTATSSPPPTPTPPPSPTARPTPSPPPTPTPLPTTFPEAGVEPTLRQPGTVTVAVNGVTTFELMQARPILQLPGHTLIYVDDDLRAEVDLFTPVADADGIPLTTYGAVANVITSIAELSGLNELAPTTVDGAPARVFDGVATLGARIFVTDQAQAGNENAGWSPPLRLRMWLIDAPNGVVALTAESLEDPGQFEESLAIARGIIDTIDLPD